MSTGRFSQTLGVETTLVRVAHDYAIDQQHTDTAFFIKDIVICLYQKASRTERCRRADFLLEEHDDV